MRIRGVCRGGGCCEGGRQVGGCRVREAATKVRRTLYRRGKNRQGPPWASTFEYRTRLQSVLCRDTAIDEDKMDVLSSLQLNNYVHDVGEGYDEGQSAKARTNPASTNPYIQ